MRPEPNRLREQNHLAATRTNSPASPMPFVRNDLRNCYPRKELLPSYSHAGCHVAHGGSLLWRRRVQEVASENTIVRQAVNPLRSWAIFRFCRRLPLSAAFTVFSVTPALLANFRIGRPDCLMSYRSSSSAVRCSVSFGRYSVTLPSSRLMPSPCSQRRSVSFPM